jgi:hypothetical protein
MPENYFFRIDSVVLAVAIYCFLSVACRRSFQQANCRDYSLFRAFFNHSPYKNPYSDQERVRTFQDMAEEYFTAYKLRLPQSTRFAAYAIDHLKRILGSKMLVDFNEGAVVHYQNARLGEKASPKSVNDEVGFLFRILGDPGDLIRIRLHKRKMLKLKVRQTVGRAFTPDEKDRMLEEARKARSPHIFPALSLALNAGNARRRNQDIDLGTDRLH